MFDKTLSLLCPWETFYVSKVVVDHVMTSYKCGITVFIYCKVNIG